MKNIIAINSEIEKLFNPKVVFYEEYQNILINERWLTEFDENIYVEKIKKIKNKITNTADLNNPKKLVYFKTFRKEILKKYKILSEFNYSDLNVVANNLEYSNSFFYSNEVPQFTSKEFILNTESKLNYKFDDILDYTGILYNVGEWYTGEIRTGIENDIDILEYMEERLSPLIFGNKNDEDLKFEKYFSNALLGDQLKFYRELIGQIAEHTEKIYQFIEKIKNQEELDFGLQDIYDNDKNRIKFKFKINKKEIVMLFKNLNDFGIFHIDKKGTNSEQTQLTKYIDNANMYFYHYKNLKPVKGINKEFAKVYGKEERIMHQDIEKKFLNDLIKKLENRVK
jgi:hypothetical protein